MTENVGPTIIMWNKKYIFIPCVLHGAVSITAKVLQSQVYLPPINQKFCSHKFTYHQSIKSSAVISLLTTNQSKVLQSQVYLPPINQKQQTAIDTSQLNICARGLQHINFILRQNSHGVNWLFVIRLISYRSIFTWLCASVQNGTEGCMQHLTMSLDSTF